MSVTQGKFKGSQQRNIFFFFLFERTILSRNTGQFYKQQQNKCRTVSDKTNETIHWIRVETAPGFKVKGQTEQIYTNN